MPQVGAGGSASISNLLSQLAGGQALGATSLPPNSLALMDSPSRGGLQLPGFAPDVSGELLSRIGSMDGGRWLSEVLLRSLSTQSPQQPHPGIIPSSILHYLRDLNSLPSPYPLRQSDGNRVALPQPPSSPTAFNLSDLPSLRNFDPGRLMIQSQVTFNV